MGLRQAMDISVSGIEAQRRMLELISSNIANINTTRTVYGGPYRRKIAVLGERPLEFSHELSVAETRLAFKTGGVEVLDVVDDKAMFRCLTSIWLMRWSR
jgi:flagellar basal-body rod protein FlgC